eukprot:6194625-Pleurochrysis_carterae.AAC.1
MPLRGRLRLHCVSAPVQLTWHNPSSRRQAVSAGVKEETHNPSSSPSQAASAGVCLGTEATNLAEAACGRRTRACSVEKHASERTYSAQRGTVCDLISSGLTVAELVRWGLELGCRQVFRAFCAHVCESGGERVSSETGGDWGANAL